MKSYLFLFFTLLQLSIFAQTDILDINRRRFDAMIAKDSVTLHQLNSEALIYVHSNGLLETKSSHISTIMTEKIDYEHFEILEIKSLIGQKKSNTVVGKVKVKGAYSKAPFDMILHFTAIYRKENKQWRLLRWQSTKVQ